VTSLRTALPPHPLWVDAVLAFAVVAAQIAATTILVHAAGSDRPMDAVAYALLVATGAPLVLRDRYPAAVLLVVAATAVVYTWLGYPGGFYTLAIVFAMWAAVAAGRRLVALLVGIGLVAVMVVARFAVTIGHAQDADAPIWIAGWLVASFVLGEVSRGRRRYLEQVEQRAIDAERTREEEARRRAGEERMRIARELHDVLAHNISTINVQAGVAAHLLDRQPEQARTALVAISEASREALRELRATLGLLRGVDEDESRAPAPGLARLDELVDNVRSTGLEVAVETDGEPAVLAPTTDLAAYRIIQESLTNVARHARAGRVSIGLRYGPRDLVITVDDDGAGPPGGATPPAGNGLTGMRERAAAAGGELEAGAGPNGGFRVRARLPLAPA
jgi:signal transduction histidine kinase